LRNIDIDPVTLFKTRLVVARHGELDRAGWWNTKGVLGSTGTAVFRRGLARTHRFAQARAVFAAAKNRCDEHFNPPRSVTLWRMPEEIEERFEAAWRMWLDEATTWEEFFLALSVPPVTSLSDILSSLGLVGADDIVAAKAMTPSPEGRSVQVPHLFSGSNSDLALLALGFERGERLVVPYARLP
jgi:hypothetical protein